MNILRGISLVKRKCFPTSAILAVLVIMAFVIVAVVRALNHPVTAAEQHSDAMDEVYILARVIAAEARGEPLAGQVAVGAVILNRVQDPSFPNTIHGVIYQPGAFESVSNGLIYRRTPNEQELRAALIAVHGWDPTYGANYFWDPATANSRWVWSRQIVRRIGGHVFAR